MATKKIKMSTTELVFPTNSGLTHTATSWQISKSLDFNSQANILAESLNDTVNLYEYKVSLDIDDNVPLYGRHKMHLSKNGLPLEATWSRICPFNSNMKGLKINNFMVKTPELTVSSEDNSIDAVGTSFGMFTGAGNHALSNWAIKSTYGEDVFVRNNDKTNLTTIHLQNIIEANKGYTVECSYGNEFNNTSFPGKEIYLNYSGDLNLYNLTFPEDFIVDRKFYYRIQLYTQQSLSFDIEIRDSDGKVVKSKYDSKELVSYFMLDNMDVYRIYHIYGRIKFTDGKVSAYKEVYSAMLLPNRVIPYKPSIGYLGQLDVGMEYQTDGFVCFTTRETYDGKIFLPSFDGDKLSIYQGFTNSAQKLSVIELANVYNFYYESNMDHINILQLPNHDILVDMVSYDSDGHKYTKFYKFEYNPITLKLTSAGELERPKEKYCTSICNSIGVLSDNTVVYVPGFYTETEDEVRSQLPLIILTNDNNNTMKITKTATLPFNAKYNVSLVVDKDDNIYVFGGSEENTYDAANDNVEYWLRSNHNVYQYDIKSDTFTQVAQLPAEWPANIYAMQAFLRLDGKIAIFNGSYSGPGLKNQDHLVFDPDNKTFTIHNTDMDWDVPFRSNVLFRNGNIGRVSYKVKDPQKSYIYISNTKTEDTVTRIEGSDSDVTDLVVDSGKIINVEDLYAYDTVTIKGTGILRWFRPQGIIELTSSDLIITRDTTMTQGGFDAGRYHSVLVLEGVNFTINSDYDYEDNPKLDADDLIKQNSLKLNVGDTIKVNVK